MGGKNWIIERGIATSTKCTDRMQSCEMTAQDVIQELMCLLHHAYRLLKTDSIACTNEVDIIKGMKGKL